MPQTVNGIGTTYFLKQNRQAEDGVCEHCNTRGRLESYETWYCICVIFIPVIPLGKKQILNYCPNCTRHRVISMREWEKIRSEAIAETSAELAESKDDFNSSIKMHATLVAVQKATEAEQLARIMLDRFGSEPQVQFYLAAWYERLGKSAVANPMFLKAHELEPENLGYTRAAAMVHLEEQRPDQARGLLTPFEATTPNYDPALFYLLAGGYQKLGRHAEALDLYRELVTSWPAATKDAAFRKSVKISEQALGVEKPLLPYDPWYSSSAVKWAAISIAVLAALGYWNYYIATNRVLHVVNGLSLPISVSVDGAPPIQIDGRSKKQVEIAEGEHKVEVTEPAGMFPPSQFKVSASWWERFLRSPVYVSDPTRSAGIVFQQTVFSRLPIADDDPGMKAEPHVGDAFTSVPHADYHFEEFPGQIRVKGGRVLKTRVGLIQEPTLDLANALDDLGKTEPEVLDFMEAHLFADPPDDQLMQTYLNKGAETALPRVKAFLEKHLTDRPIRVLFHRRYQDLVRTPLDGVIHPDQEAALIKKYDAWLQAEPNNASLQALRGRLGDRASTVLPYLNRALELDPNNPPALLSKAYTLRNTGDMQHGLELNVQALAANPNDSEYQRVLREARLANGDFEPLVTELKQTLAAEPHDLRATLELLKAYLAKGDAAAATQEYQAAQPRFEAFRATPPLAKILVEQLDVQYLYATGNLAAAQEKLDQLKDPTGTVETAFMLGLETGKLPEVPASVHVFRKPYWHLCRSLAASKQGNAEQATAAKAAAIELLKKGDEGQVSLAKLLDKPTEAKFEDASDLLFAESDKATFLVALATDAPEIRDQCLDLAEKLNYELAFPYHLLKASIADLRGKK